MRSASAKAKGRRVCAEARELLLRYAPDDLESGDIEITSSGATGKDLRLSPAALRKYPLVIEGKCHERLNIWEALEQAEAHAKKETTWVAPTVFFRRNHSKLYVALGAEDFVKLVVA